MAALARVDDIESSRLASGLDDAFALVAGRFSRREVRVRARACVAGMLSGLERKTGWPLAEHAGDGSPDGMQRLFAAARRDEDLVRDDVRGYVVSAQPPRKQPSRRARFTTSRPGAASQQAVFRKELMG
jgi:hypothetical protein